MSFITCISLGHYHEICTKKEGKKFSGRLIIRERRGWEATMQEFLGDGILSRAKEGEA